MIPSLIGDGDGYTGRNVTSELAYLVEGLRNERHTSFGSDRSEQRTDAIVFFDAFWLSFKGANHWVSLSW